jgi:two-component system, sensor histidine kinase and response regulator
MNFENVHVLIAEDSPTQAEQLKFILERRGCQVAWAANGNDALAMMERRKPVVVISDIVMPGMDGYRLCKRIREQEAFREVPFILLTSLSDPEDVIKGLECGADNFITKPYDEDDLVSRIQYTLANCRVREHERTQAGVEVVFAGRTHFITSDRLQILNLLLSTYETAIHKNRQLTQARDELKSLNEELDERVRERTAEIQSLNANLEKRVAERTAELLDANKELDAFANSVSHDLRTPLRHIHGFAEMLNKRIAEGLDAVSAKYLANITDASLRMSRLIDDLLSFSRVTRLNMRKVRVDMRTLLDECIRELAPETSGRNIVWEIGELPEVEGDPSMLKQVLANLLSNAVKFTGKVSRAIIEIQAVPEKENEVTFLVRDNGAGFDMEYSDKLFGVFQRLHTQQDFEGTGIGLANVRRIITRHGGRVWAESAVDQGATFYFRLPLPGAGPV